MRVGRYNMIEGDFPCCLRNTPKAQDPVFNFVAVTWNACVVKAGGIAEIVAMMDAGSRWDVLILQEGPFVADRKYSN